METITVPEQLSNGAIVLDYKLEHNGGNGYRPHGVAICYWENSNHHLVTWRIYHKDGEWHAESGEYYLNIFEAVESFKRRGGK